MARMPAKARARTKQGPDAAQIKAVERLLEEEDYTQAVRRIKPLVRRYPDHGGLRRALVEALEQGEGPRAAAVAALAWTERRPNSLPAQEALLHFAQALHHLMLAERTAGKVRALAGQTPGFPLDPALKAAMLVLPDGTRTSVEDLERFDLGKLHLEGADFRGAVRWLAASDLLPARNNHALALFHLNRVDDAYGAFMASWRAVPTTCSPSAGRHACAFTAGRYGCAGPVRPARRGHGATPGRRAAAARRPPAARGGSARLGGVRACAGE